MEKIGIICEYNPFHNGHEYHLKQVKKMFPDALIILIIDGYFMQRGEISLLTKESKTSLALLYGADIVIEMPTLYATQSADTFAKGAITLLNELKVDKIVFGSESNNLSLLTEIAQKSAENDHSKEVKAYLDKGYNYPTALAKSLGTDFVFNPNDLLAISYIKAINAINPHIEPIAIQRTSNYHDLESNDFIISASNIRGKITKGEKIDNYVPKEVVDKIIKPDYDLYYKIIKAIILRDNNLENILDIDEGIEYRLKKGAKKCDNLQDFISYVKSKRYTYNKISRMLVHLLLNITKEDATITPDYLNILGFNQKGKKYLNVIKKNINLPLQNKDSRIKEIELKASLIYDLLTGENTQKKELSNKPIFRC